MGSHHHPCPAIHKFFHRGFVLIRRTCQARSGEKGGGLPLLRLPNFRRTSYQKITASAQQASELSSQDEDGVSQERTEPKVPEEQCRTRCCTPSRPPGLH